jgi:hypothetical protein
MVSGSVVAGPKQLALEHTCAWTWIARKTARQSAFVIVLLRDSAS